MTPPTQQQAARPGPSGLPSLPDLSSAPASGPDREGPGSGAFSRPPIGSLPSSDSPDIPGLDSEEEQADEPNELLDLASFLFGVKFKSDALIVDSTMAPAELCPAVDRSLPMTSFAEVGRIPSANPATIVAAMFGSQARPPADPVALGKLLCSHPLVERLLSASHEQAKTIDQIEPHSPGDASLVNQGVQRVASVLGDARRLVGSRLSPMVRLDSQLSLRPLSRVVRLVGARPEFAPPGGVALDHPSAITPPGLEDAPAANSRRYLPAVACSSCGASGWLAALLGHDHQVASLPSRISAPLGDQGGHLAILMAVDRPVGNNDSTRWLHQETLALDIPDDGSQLPEHITVRLASGATAVSARRCPVCDQSGVVDLIGVDARGLTTGLTNRLVSESGGRQGRLVVLTDSADSADNQIDALADDSYAISLRRRLVEMIAQVAPAGNGSLSLPDLAATLIDWQGNDNRPSELAPADLRDDPRLVSLWSDNPSDADLAVLRNRVEFELGREFGQRSAEATSLSSTGAVSISIDAGPLDQTVQDLRSKLAETADLVVSAESVTDYLQGLLDKLRLDGAIGTGLLRPFVDEGGDPAFVTGSRPAGLPELLGSQRPRFVTTSPTGGFTSVTAIHQHSGGPRSWLVDWACSTLGINSVDAPAINWFALEALTKTHGAVFAVDSFDGHRVYGLVPDAIKVAPGRVSARQLDDMRQPGVTVRAASTVGVSPVEKVRTEWTFKYGAPVEAPNVLYMSAGHVRADRDVIDTTIDLAVVDTIVADAAALAELGSIPEVRRVGITSGFGTVVLIEPEQSTPRGRAKPQEQQASEAEGHATSPDSSLETAAGLPPLPDRHRTNEDDYFDYLFDRLTDDKIHFAFEFETLDQMMKLATSLPAGHGTAELSPSAPVGEPGDAQPAAEPKTVDLGGVMVPEIDFSFIPTEYGSEDKPLFETLDQASKAASSLTKPGPVDDYLRIVAPDHDDEQAERLRRFASEGVAPRLDALRSAWDQATGEAAVRELTFEPWQDGVQTLERGHIDSNDTAPTTQAEASTDPTPTETSAWVIGDDVVQVEFLGGDRPQLLLRPPILDIQGQVRIDSFVRAFLLGLSRTDHMAALVAAGLSVEARLVQTDSATIKRGELVLRGDQGSTEGLADLAKSDALKSVLEAARRAMDDCSCADGRQAACTECLLGEWDQVSLRPPDGIDASSGDVAVSRWLATETIDAALHGWSPPKTVKTLSLAVPKLLARSELARGFELALKVWLQREPDVLGRFDQVDSQASGSERSFDLSMTFADVEMKYRVEAAFDADLLGVPVDGDQPAYRVSPIDGEWPIIELFLDPFDSDVDSLIAAITTVNGLGKLGWLLRWNDVREFYQAAASAEAADVPDRTIMSPRAREIAVDLLSATSNRVRVDSLEQNPFALMLDVMVRPVAGDWAKAVAAAQTGVLQDSDASRGDTADEELTENSVVWAVLAGLSAKDG